MKKTLIYIALIAIVSIVTVALAGQDSTGRTDAGWTTDYNKALAQAKSENKMVLLNFTGSDWCPWCMKLDSEVFDQREFKDYASKHLVLVDLDFPRFKPQPPSITRQNEELRERYDVEGFPTVVILDSQGRKVGELGYEPGGPKVFLDELAKLPGQ